MTWPPPVGAAVGGVILLLVAAGAWRFVRRRRRVAEAFGDPVLLARLLGRDLRRPPWRRVALLVAGALALALALVDPRWGTGEAAGMAAGGPVVLVIDVSSSMLVEDANPSRLAWARAAAAQLARELGDVPIGIVVFAGRAYALTPPTRDPGAVDLYLDALDTGMITQTGSALGGALRQGVGLLLAGEGESGALVVISDGNTAEDAADVEEAIDLARRADIPVFTLGVGTVGGGPVPDLDPVTGERLGYKRLATGEVITSHLADGLLAAVASGTGGGYLPADESAPGQLAELVRSRPGGGGGVRMEGPPRFAWFAAAALLLLAAEGLVGRGPGDAMNRIFALMLVPLGASGCDRMGGVVQGTAEPADSVAMYRELAAARPGDPLPLYDLGTVLLIRRRYDEARPPLELAVRASEPELRHRAHYNLGNTRLEPAFAAGAGVDADERARRADELRQAAESYREALRITPDDLDAKWNLELAQRRLERERAPPPEPPEPPKPEGEGGGGGGGGAGGAGGGGSDSESADQDPRPQAGAGGGQRPRMTEEQAEELLANARDREVGVQRETLRKPQPRNSTAH